MTESDLLEMFEDKAIYCGSELIVNKIYCRDFLQVSKSGGFAVIGIEGFHLLKDGSIKPNLDEIADFSDIEPENNAIEYLEACFKAANIFVTYMESNGISDGYCFTLTDSKI